MTPHGNRTAAAAAAAGFRETSGRTGERKGRARVSSRGGGTRGQDVLSPSPRRRGEEAARRGARKETDRWEARMVRRGARKGNLLRFGTSLSGERSGAGPHG